MRTAPRTWDLYRSEFPIFERTTYLNTCSLAPLGRRVAEAIQTCLDLWQRMGASAWYGPWWEEIGRLRERLARVLGAAPEEIALFPSVTAALSAVASALDYRARPRVVLSALEFPTTRYQWLTKPELETVIVGRPGDLVVRTQDYAAAADDRTALVVASHVHFTSGMIQDIEAFADVAHARGAYCLVDAYQSIGQVPLDVSRTGVDFLVGGSLKWLLGGSGLAFLYVRADLHARLQPRVVGWFAHRDQFTFSPTFEYADDARRFEGGTPSITAVYAASAGVEMVLEIGVERLRARQLELTADLVDRARAAGFSPRVPEDLTRHAGIVTIPCADPPAVVRGLADRGVIVDSRPGIIRLSPYFFNAPDDHRRAVESLRALTG